MSKRFYTAANSNLIPESICMCLLYVFVVIHISITYIINLSKECDAGPRPFNLDPLGVFQIGPGLGLIRFCKLKRHFGNWAHKHLNPMQFLFTSSWNISYSLSFAILTSANTAIAIKAICIVVHSCFLSPSKCLIYFEFVECKHIFMYLEYTYRKKPSNI